MPAFPPIVHPMVDRALLKATPQWTTYFNAVAALTLFDSLPASLSASTLLGRGSSGEGAAQAITIGAGLTMTGETLEADPTAVTPFPNTGLTIKDTTGFFTLTLNPASSFSANRTLHFITGDASHNITINGSTVLNDWFDQSVKTTASPAFADLTINGQAFTVNGPPTLDNWFDQSVKTTASPTFNQVNATTVDSANYEANGVPGIAGVYDVLLNGGGNVQLTFSEGLLISDT